MQLSLLSNMMMSKNKIPELLYYAKDDEACINRLLRQSLVPKYCDSVRVRRKIKNIFVVQLQLNSYIYSALLEMQFHDLKETALNILGFRPNRQSVSPERLTHFLERRRTNA